MEQRIKAGDIVKHFKRELMAEASDMRDNLSYLYEVVSIDGLDTETQARVVIYQALYGERRFFVRPYDDFMGETDHKKYPQVNQKYRFESV